MDGLKWDLNAVGYNLSGLFKKVLMSFRIGGSELLGRPCKNKRILQKCVTAFMQNLHSERAVRTSGVRCDKKFDPVMTSD